MGGGCHHEWCRCKFRRTIIKDHMFIYRNMTQNSLNIFFLSWTTGSHLINFQNLLAFISCKAHPWLNWFISPEQSYSGDFCSPPSLCKIYISKHRSKLNGCKRVNVFISIFENKLLCEWKNSINAQDIAYI